jgi:hypothetical protein
MHTLGAPKIDALLGVGRGSGSSCYVEQTDAQSPSGGAYQHLLPTTRLALHVLLEVTGLTTFFVRLQGFDCATSGLPP